MTEGLVREVFRKNVAHERNEQGWTQKELAKKMGVSFQTIQNVEMNGAMSPKMIAAFCKVFDIDPWVLFIEEGK